MQRVPIPACCCSRAASRAAASSLSFACAFSAATSGSGLKNSRRRGLSTRLMNRTSPPGESYRVVLSNAYEGSGTVAAGVSRRIPLACRSWSSKSERTDRRSRIRLEPSRCEILNLLGRELDSLSLRDTRSNVTHELFDVDAAALVTATLALPLWLASVTPAAVRASPAAVKSATASLRCMFHCHSCPVRANCPAPSSRPSSRRASELFALCPGATPIA